MFLWSKVRRVRKVDNLTTILNISQPYRPPRPITGIAFSMDVFFITCVFLLTLFLFMTIVTCSRTHCLHQTIIMQCTKLKFKS
jgi:hypothetical protein